ncbi:MAG TPA: T9SS type A sorting domain-containing protein [Chitinophagaceae bacterium]|nr:T9SS type A sorting domain-containing protein [Chitinophagaceae bacterium]
MKKIFILLVFSFQGVNSMAQSCNTIDPTFGTGGIATGYTYNGNNGWLSSSNILVQPDNKIIQIAVIRDASNVSKFAVIRYKSTGSLDSTFGTNGRVITSVGSGDSYPAEGAIQADGKIVVTGQTLNANKWTFGLVRYNSDGSLDNSFGTNGKVITQVGLVYDHPNGLAIQSDGKIIVVGSSSDGNYVPAYAVLRYKTNGSVDSTFGNNGIIVSHLGPFITSIDGVYYGTYSDEYAKSVVIQSDEKIVVAGESYTYNDCYHDDYYGGVYCTRVFAMVRYNSNGSLDNTFGNNGKVIDSVSLSYISSAVLQTDGKILVSGTGNAGGFKVNRYKIDGSLDSSFGTNGKVVTAVGQDNYPNPNSLAVQPDGKIVLGGSVDANNNTNFAVVRYNSNGSPDNTFNINGIAVFRTGQQGSYDEAMGVAVQNNKIVVGGHSNSYSNNNSNNNLNLVVVKLNETNYAFSPTITATGAVNVCRGESVRLSSSETGSVQWYVNGAAINGATNTVYYATTSGSYSVLVNNSNGCGVSAPKVVTVDSPQEPTINWNGSLTFCDGGSVTISTSSPDNLQWFRNNNPISGATSSTYNATISGTYLVKATNTAGCSISSSPVIVNVKSNTPPTLSWNGPLLFCDGGNVILSTTNPDNHQWYQNSNLITGATGATYSVTTSGSYTESNGCAVSAPVIVTVNNSPPKPPIIWNTPQFSTTAGHAHYEWALNGALITGIDSNIYKPVTTGSYKVSVININGCRSTSDNFNLVVLAVADITVGDTKLRYYPNPARTVLNIDITNPFYSKLEAALYDITGKLLLKQSLNQNRNQLPVRQLPSGIYQLLIHNDHERIMLKVVVIK